MKTMRMRAILSTAVVAAVCLTQTTLANADAASSITTPRVSTGAYGPKGFPGKTLVHVPRDQGVTFHYVAGSVIGAADGASVQIDQAQPKVGPAYHSLVELAVESLDSRQIVEVGWTVDPGLNGDAVPHLFVFHWVNGTPTCYNGCGYVQVSSAIHPGGTVRPGDSQTYGIVHTGGKWWLGYAGTWFGYFPDSLWNGAYTKAGLSQAFGEVATNGSNSCTMMGNGIFGTQPGSVAVSRFGLSSPTVPVPALEPLVTDPLHYNQGNLSSAAFRLGGPGAC
jgi:hypothetical protein